MSENTTPRVNRGRFLLVVLVTAAATYGITALLMTIFEHKEEAKNTYIRFVDVTEETTDPEVWGKNWPREFDSYKKTAEQTRTRFGGHGGSESLPDEKSVRDPWLTRAFVGYAFSIDYRDRRGHAYMLYDQEHTKRVTERPQPGSCLHCHASIIPTYRRVGDGDVMKGFEALCKLPYAQANAEVQKTGSMNPVGVGEGKTEFHHVDGAHPVSCVDCHDPNNMQLRVTRPGFIRGIAAFMASQGKPDYDPNRDATRQQMRTFVCAQCHVEYYCGPKTTLFFPWNKGLRVEQIEDYYDNYKFPDGHRFYDWKHAETGAELLKAQHPEFEMWNQGVHAAAGVACADCHMPYQREGAMKVSDHWVRSPLLNIQRSCQPCHAVPEEEIKARVDRIQERHFELLTRSGHALVDMLDTIKAVRAPWDQANRAAAETAAREKLSKDEAFAKLSTDEQAAKLKQAATGLLNDRWSEHVYADPKLTEIAELHRKAQWRLDFVAAENSTGFHAPQEGARILGESIDYARQAQLAAQKLLGAPATEQADRGSGEAAH
jgi:nitrite reductase (cytochrome c-552)